MFLRIECNPMLPILQGVAIYVCDDIAFDILVSIFFSTPCPFRFATTCVDNYGSTFCTWHIFCLCDLQNRPEVGFVYIYYIVLFPYYYIVILLRICSSILPQRRLIMARGDKVIYQQFHGKMTKISASKLGDGHNCFVIVWKGRDWSGFRTLPECERQFSELESMPDAGQDNFAVVERF